MADDAERGETDADTCAFDDLALVMIDPADVGKVNPSIPFWVGPTGLDADGTVTGDKVLSYGNGWSHTVYTVTPGIPGDSGSAFLNRTGRALGVLSTVAIAPVAGSNGVGDLAEELAYLAVHSGLSVTLQSGTEPFRGPLLPT